MGRERWLLWCGVVGAPFFVLVFLVNDQLKPYYDPARDFVSEASVGRGGWVQIAAFLITGALLAAYSIAVRRVVSRWTGTLIGLLAFALVVAGVFVPDPSPAYEDEWTGILHDSVSLVALTVLAAACVTAASWRPSPSWRAYCLLVAAVIPVMLGLAAAVTALAGTLQRIAIVVGFVWLAVLGLRALASLAGEATTRR